MAVYRSTIDVADPAFVKNRVDMLEQLEALADLQRDAAAGGGAQAMERLRGRGKMPVRERIQHLLDPDSPFYEISSVAAYSSNYDIGGGAVIGIGVVSGIECMILGNDPTVLGGAMTAYSVKKLMRAIQICRENRLPYIQFVESAGVSTVVA